MLLPTPALPYPLYWQGCSYSHTVDIRAEKCVLGKGGQRMVFQLPVFNYQLCKFLNPDHCSVTKPLQFMPSEILNQQMRLAIIFFTVETLNQMLNAGPV